MPEIQASGLHLCEIPGETMTLNVDECKAIGVDQKAVRKLAARLERCAMDARKLGLTIFGGAHSGDLRSTADINADQRRVIVAHMDGPWDGGDGGCSLFNGLECGE